MTRTERVLASATVTKDGAEGREGDGTPEILVLSQQGINDASSARFVPLRAWCNMVQEQPYEGETDGLSEYPRPEADVRAPTAPR